MLVEIDKKFKESEEVSAFLMLTEFIVPQGIELVQGLQTKLNNASTLNMKEKFVAEIKREIKKLQRLREFFRSN